MTISQPSIYKSKLNKNYVHKILLNKSQSIYRKSHFVESKLVCFKRSYIESTLYPFLIENNEYLKSGWGIDIWWSYFNKNDLYIVDKIKIEEKIRSKLDNNKGFIEMKNYISKYKLKLKI